MPSQRVLRAVVAICVIFSLGPHVAGQPTPRTDRHGEPLPAGAIGRLGTARLRYGRDVTLAFLPDGKTLAVLGAGPALPVTFLDRVTGKELSHYRLGQDKDTGGRLTLSPDRKRLVWCEHSRVVVYDLASGKRLHVLALDQGDNPASAPLGFPGDGDFVLAVRDDRTGADVWDVRTGQKRHRLRPPQGMDIVKAVALSPDGRRMIAQGDGTNERVVWDLASGKILYRFPSHSPLKVPVFAPDGMCFATTGEDDRPVILREAATGKQLLVASKDESAYNIAFSPDSKLLAIAVANGRIRIYDVAQRKECQTLNGPAGHVDSLVFSRDGQTLVSINCNTESATCVQCWQLPTGNWSRRIDLPKGETATSWVLSNDGKMLACVNGGAIRRWDLLTGKELPLPPGATHEIKHLVIAPDSRTVAAFYANDHIVTWDAKTQSSRAEWRFEGTSMIEPGFTPDGKSLVAILGALSFAVNDQGAVRAGLGPAVAIRGPLSFAVYRWDVATGCVCRKDVLHNVDAEHLGLGVSPDGRPVSWAFPSAGLTVVDLISSKRHTIRPARASKRRSVPFPLAGAVTPDGRRLACVAIDAAALKQENESALRRRYTLRNGTSRIAASCHASQCHRHSCLDSPRDTRRADESWPASRPAHLCMILPSSTLAGK